MSTRNIEKIPGVFSKKEVIMKFKLAVFDMDGTILDTLEDLQDSLNAILAKYGYPVRTFEEVRSFVGNGILKLIERAVPAECNAEEIQKVYQDFLPYYREHSADKTRPYRGITELLEQLKKSGMKLAVVSNKADAAVQDLCVQYFDGLFDVAAGERDGIAKKPDPAMVEFVLKTLEVSKEEAVYIGDSEVDIATACNSGLHLCAVEWGFRDIEVLKEHGAEYIFSDPKSLQEYLLEE